MVLKGQRHIITRIYSWCSWPVCVLNRTPEREPFSSNDAFPSDFPVSTCSPSISSSKPPAQESECCSIYPPFLPFFCSVLLMCEDVFPTGAAAGATCSRPAEGREATILTCAEERVLQPTHTTGNAQAAWEQVTHARPWPAEWVAEL